MTRLVRSVPNLLTAIRLLLAPYVFLLMTRREYGLVIPWFIAIAVTDSLDGFLARRWNASSRFGAYLDPITDKVLLSGSFLVLALTGAIDAWIAIVVLGRDLLILLGAGILYLNKSRLDFPPSVWGKLSTFVQILFVCFQVGALAGIQVELVAATLQWAAAALALISLGGYARSAFARAAGVKPPAITIDRE